MRPDVGDAGFSLVETLVSLAVIAAMSGLLFDTLGTNARFASNIAKRREAILLAQSMLAAATAPTIADMSDTGNVHGLTWRVTRAARRDGQGGAGVPLQEVRVVVADAATGRSLADVRTLRLTR